MKKVLFIACLFCWTINTQAQNINDVFQGLLGETPLEEDLQELCDEIGGRVTGSKANEKAVEWGLKKFQEAGVKAWKEEVKMPVLWMAGYSEAHISGTVDFKPNVVAKYQSPPGKYKAELIFAGMGKEADFEPIKEKIKGKFVLVETDLCLDINGLFAEYEAAAETEKMAYQYGAKGIVFMSSRPLGLLYRFISSKTTENDMPQLVMPRQDAQRCVRILQGGGRLKVNLKIDAKTGGAFTTHNVIAEIPGTEKPEEVIVIGAHLDSWALGTGANDNGCNVSMMIDIARQMVKYKIKPKRTIRFALWNGEEQGYFGSWAYTQKYAKEMDNHVMALSVDIGSGPIVGFFTNGREELIGALNNALAPLEAQLADTTAEYSHLDAIIIGTDNFDFMLQGVPNLVAIHQPESYGLNYHASSDTFDKVNLEALKSNSAMVAIMTLYFANEAPKLKRHTRGEIQKMFEDKKMEYTMRMFNVWEVWMSKARGRK